MILLFFGVKKYISQMFAKIISKSVQQKSESESEFVYVKNQQRGQ